MNPVEDNSYRNPILFTPRTLHSYLENGSEEILPGLAEAVRYSLGSCLFPLPPASAPLHHLTGSSSPEVFLPCKAPPSPTEHIPGFRGHPKPDQIWQWAHQHLLLASLSSCSDLYIKIRISNKQNQLGRLPFFFFFYYFLLWK